MNNEFEGLWNQSFVACSSLACVGRPTKAKKIPGDYSLVSTAFFFLLTTFYFSAFNYRSSHFNQYVELLLRGC